MGPTHPLFQRVRAEYFEMPGMNLTAPQVQRLCGIDAELCKVLLDSLVDARVLCLKSDGRYALDLRPRPAKMDLARTWSKARANFSGAA